ncbi:MAG TPA: response regulator transcription factor [Prolixibacteraceae bacterium]|nr:response regulator transcription factor [Prolixibacteraceae bacterium]
MNSEKTPKILVVDDEKDLCEILEFNLSSEGFEVEIAHSAEEALKKPLADFDLVLLDVMMGEMSGYKMASKMRKELKLSVPVIFLTAKTTENDILTGFNVGGDDYISKPFSIKEMMARVKAVLKRGKSVSQESDVLEADELEVDTLSKTVTIKQKQVNLTRKEYEILIMLLKNKNHYISREEILDRIWNDDVIVTERNVDVNIARLRKKIGAYGENIKGKSGYGYSFKIQ